MTRSASGLALCALLIFGLGLFVPSLSFAQGEHGESHGSQADPLVDVSFEQRLNEQVPLDIPFVDEQGNPVTLGSYFGDKPVLLQLSYYECPMLCPLVREGMLTALDEVKLQVGTDFQVVNVSIDPLETPMIAANAKAAALSRYNQPGAEAGLHFLTGTQDSIDQLASAIGFRYIYDETIDQYAHAAGIVALTPTGLLSRYFYGVEYNPSDLRLGLVEASDNQIGSPVDQLLLLCYHYDPVTGRYTGTVMTIIRIAGILTIATLVFMVVMLNRGSGRPGSPRGPAQAMG